MIYVLVAEWVDMCDIMDAEVYATLFQLTSHMHKFIVEILFLLRHPSIIF